MNAMREIGEFDAPVINGEVIQIPDVYKRELANLEHVHVVLLTQEPLNVRRKGVIEEMMENPVIIPDFKPPSREENYEGRYGLH